MSEDPAPTDFTEVTKIQERAVQEAIEALKNGQAVLIEAPTGSGKTRISARIIEELEKIHGADLSALNLSHRELLARQGMDEFAKWAPESKLSTSIAYDGALDQSGQNVYSLVQTAAARQDELKAYDVVGIDEAHHASDSKSGDYNEVLLTLLEKNPKAKIVATTATPSRPDKKGLSPLLKDAARVTIGWAELERAGQIKLPRTIELPIQARQGGTVNQVARAHYRPEKDANAAGLTKAIRAARTDSFNEEMANAWERHAEGLSTIAYASRIDDARAFAKEMKERGHRVDVVDSDMGRDHNNAVLEKYGAGELDMVVSVKMIDEGLNVPATRCVLILRETTSEIEYSQMVGRAIRAGNTPELRSTQPIVLDGGASTMIHGAIERRAAVIDYLQRLERGERSEKITTKPLIEGRETQTASEAAYTPWRKMKEEPTVLALTDGTSVIFAVESRDAEGQPRYTLAEAVQDKKHTRLAIMKDENNRPLSNISGSILQEIEANRIVPSRAALLRMEATRSSAPNERSTLADDKIADASAAHLDSALVFAHHLRQSAGASR